MMVRLSSSKSIRLTSMMRSWPKVFSFTIGMIPVLLLAVVVSILVWKSTFIFYRGVTLGELFSFNFHTYRYDGYYEFGLMPSIIATCMVVLGALAIALPVSLAIAIYACEYAAGAIGKALRAILGTLAGIPPIVYALTAFLFFNLLITPSFARESTVVVQATISGMQLAQNWRNPLLGMIVLALLIIPFMAPLIDEAIRNVPSSLKEASLALGAGRWYTLTNVIIPVAMPGIIAACALGCLKAMGDLMIVAFTCFTHGSWPDSLWDIMRMSPLTGTIGQLSFVLDPVLVEIEGLPLAVSYFGALLLLVMALIVLGIATWLQRWFRKRYHA